MRMKYGLFVHQLVEDPGEGDPGFGRLRNGEIECSEEGHQVKTYLDNLRIVKELRKEYNIFTLDKLALAVRRLSGSDPLDDYDFMITNVPPYSYRRRMSSDERVNYAISLDALKKIRSVRPEMILIAYTGAPKVIRGACLELGAFVLHRERFGLDTEIQELKRMAEGEASADSAW